MNKQHCIVWSDSKQAWVVAHEAAKSKGKGSTAGVSVAASALLALLTATCPTAQAGPITPATLPTGAQVVSGQAVLNQNGNRLDINQTSDKAILNWNSFSIGSAAQVNFNQPGSNSVALNRVIGSDPSAIYGSLTANGQVFLVNPSGVLFGSGARVDVGGLVASSMSITNADFLSGNNRFTRDGSTASVVNEGDIYAKYVALLAPEVRNSGVITANMGTVALAAGDAVTLNISGNNLVDVQVDPASVATLVQNRQLIQADDGTVILSAQAASGLMSRVVNTGAIEANGVTQNGGTIYLSAGQEVSQSGSLSANAGALGNGGHITVLANLANPGSQTVVDGSISAQGGRLGGDGGQVETSGSHLQIADSLRVNTSAANGRSGGWLLDPNDFTIAASGGNMTGSAIATNLQTSDVTIATATQGTSGGNGDIFVNDNIAVAGTSAGHSLTLQAQRNIVVQAGNAITDAAANPISVNLQSGGAVVFKDNANASSAVTAVNIHGNLAIGGLNCTPGSTCYATGNALYAMGAYVGRYVSLNTNGADINIAGKAFTGAGTASLGSQTANLPLGVIAGTFSSLNARNISLYGESANNGGIQVNYGDPCANQTTCTVDTKLNASNRITVVGNATAGNNSGLSVNGSTWTAPTISLTGATSGAVAGLVINGVGYGTPTFNAASALNWTADKLAISATSLLGTGVLSIKPYGTSFSAPFSWPGSALTMAAPLSGLTIGQTGNTASISVSGVQTVNGDINLIADGAGGNVTLASGTHLTAASGGNINVAAGGNFVNNAGSSALATSGGGRWLVYSNAPATDTFGGLSSGNLALWNKTYAGYLPGSVTQSGNRYLFINQPGLTVTTTNASKTYGQVLDLSNPIAGSNYTVSGLINAATYGGVFSQDSYSGAPALTSSGVLATSSVAGSPYAITASAGSFVAPAGYSATTYVNGNLSVTPASLTITASNATKTYGQTPILSAFSSSGLQNGETIGSVTEVSAGTAATAGVASSPYVVTPSAATGGTFNAANYSIAYANGSLSVTPAALTISASNATKTYDGTPYSGGNGVTFSGFVNNETASVLGGVLTYGGTSQGAVNAGSYVVSPSGLTSANYLITSVAGTLTIGKATLIATADNQSRIWGDVNPRLTISYDGFKNGDTVSSLNSEPVASTSANPNSVPSSYEITLTGGKSNNYILQLNNGVLTISHNSGSALPGTINASASAIVLSGAAMVLSLSPTVLSTIINNSTDINIQQSNSAIRQIIIPTDSILPTVIPGSTVNDSSLLTSNVNLPFVGTILDDNHANDMQLPDPDAAMNSINSLPDNGRISFLETLASTDKYIDFKTKGADAQKFLSGIAAALKADPRFSLSHLQSYGIPVSHLKIYGFSMADLRGVGYNLADLKTAGYSASDFNAYGYRVSDLKTVGYSASDLKTAGYSASDLKTAKFSVSDLKVAGYSASDLRAAGFSASNLKAAGYSASDLGAAGLSDFYLKK